MKGDFNIENLPLDYKQAADLAARIVEQDEDEQILAFIVLLANLCYTEKQVDRESVFFAASREAYSSTRHCDTAFDEFVATNYKDLFR